MEPPQRAESAVQSSERRELHCSILALTVKLGLIGVAAVSLCRLGGAFQLRMERHGELAAVLELQNVGLARARRRFDQLFMVEGEQRLLREQSQWIAPNRLRVVWQSQGSSPPPSPSASPAPDPASSRRVAGDGTDGAAAAVPLLGEGSEPAAISPSQRLQPRSQDRPAAVAAVLPPLAAASSREHP